MIEKKQKGWKPGQSGNPKGKTPGSGELQRLRASIAGDVPDILAGLVLAAKGGDIQAARLILERVLPPVKAIELPQALDFPNAGTLSAQGRAVLRAVTAGEIAHGQGAALLGAIGALSRITEVDELETRITKLENQNGRT